MSEQGYAASRKDILELCRHLSKLLGRGPGHWDIPDAFKKAADEIERLREALKTVRAARDGHD